MSGEAGGSFSDLGKQHSLAFKAEYLHCRTKHHPEEHRGHRVLGSGCQGVLTGEGWRQEGGSSGEAWLVTSDIHPIPALRL